jgi:hypothetical protein
LTRLPPLGQDLLIHEVSRWITTVGRTPLDDWSARRKDTNLTTHNTHNRQTSMRPGGILTQNVIRRAAVDLRLRPRDHWDRQINISSTNLQRVINKCIVYLILNCM